MKTFFETFAALYAGLGPDFYLHVASMVGAFIGLIFFPPDGWKAGVLQVIASYFISHYGSIGTMKALPTWPEQPLRFGLGVTGYVLGQGIAKVAKQFREDATGTIWESILKVVVKVREVFPKKD